MKNENFKIMIGTLEADDIYPDLISLEVEMDERLAGMARIMLPLKQWQNGSWSYLDDSRFNVWEKVTIKAGFDRITELFSGYITHVKPFFAPEITRCYLEIWVMDKRVRLDREEKLTAWNNKKDSDIAREILVKHGFKAEVEDTKIVHDDKVSTIIQRETDLHFLDRLASRNGFEFFVEGNTAFFRKPDYKGAPQPVLAVHFGENTTMGRFDIEVNGLTAADIGMFGVNRLAKEVEKSEVKESGDTILGKNGPGKFSAAGLPGPKAFIGMNPVSGKPEMDALCNSVFHRAQWFVTAEGEIAGNLYGHVLRTRKTVTVKGIGETFSGVYYVTHVTHSFTPEKGYIQRFKVKRNALMPTGTETFFSKLELAALGAAGMGISMLPGAGAGG